MDFVTCGLMYEINKNNDELGTSLNMNLSHKEQISLEDYTLH